MRVDTPTTSTIVILDFGSQYTQLIARRIREFNVFSVVLPCTVGLAQVEALAPKGLILSGGPSSVYDADAPAADPKVLEMGVPVLGICYGLQFIAHHLGGKVEPAPRREYGHAEVEVVAESRLFQRAAGDDRCLDVAWGRGEGAARRLCPDGKHRQCVGGIRERRARDLGGAVSSGGGAHASRDGAAEELRARHLRG